MLCDELFQDGKFLEPERRPGDSLLEYRRRCILAAVCQKIEKLQQSNNPEVRDIALILEFAVLKG